MIDLARLIMEVSGLTGAITCHPAPEGSVHRRAPDTSKLRRLTGFEEEWTLRDGLSDMIHRDGKL